MPDCSEIRLRASFAPPPGPLMPTNSLISSLLLAEKGLLKTQRSASPCHLYRLQQYRSVQLVPPIGSTAGTVSPPPARLVLRPDATSTASTRTFTVMVTPIRYAPSVIRGSNETPTAPSRRSPSHLISLDALLAHGVSSGRSPRVILVMPLRDLFTGQDTGLKKKGSRATSRRDPCRLQGTQSTACRIRSLRSP
jgi:hypothetical protein